MTIGYQQINGPLLVAIANGEFEKATGYKIDWRQFDLGGKVATAMASGDVQIGVVGSSPLAAVVSRGVDLQLFYLAMGSRRRRVWSCVTDQQFNKPADLVGKKIGVPFSPVSTTHFHLMVALQMWGSIRPRSRFSTPAEPNRSRLGTRRH